MLIINNDLFLRHRRDVVSVAYDYDVVIVTLSNGFRASFSSASPFDDAAALAKLVFYVDSRDDPNTTERFEMSK